jgi:FtsH-binding integral membrane protein
MNFNSLVNRRINWKALGEFSGITPEIRRHLTKVYSTLTVALMFAAIGSAVHLFYRAGGLLSLLGSIAAIMWLALTPPTQENTPKRVGILFGFAFLKGLTIGPLIATAIKVDPSIVPTAFLGTASVFGCFSACAIFAERRSFLYLGGLLSSALSLMFTMSLINIFIGSAMVHLFQLYFGLLMFCGFVIFDTQLIIEKVYMGEKDFVWHTLELFIDFINIFVRLVILLTKDKKEKNSNK